MATIIKNANPHRVFFLLILCIVLLTGGFLGGVEYERRMLYRYTLLLPTGVTPEEIAQRQHEDYIVKKNCPYYGEIEKSQYLSTYTVKKGDSLLSIATKEYGNTNSIKTLVALNHDRYTSLTESSPFLEVGWILYLAPTYLIPQEFNVRAFAGELGKKNVNGETTLYVPNGGGGGLFNPDTVVKPYKDDIHEGDCVVIINSWEPGNVIPKALFLQQHLNSKK